MSLGLMLNSQILKINRLITSLICQMQISLRMTMFPILIISQSSSRVVSADNSPVRLFSKTPMKTMDSSLRTLR